MNFYIKYSNDFEREIVSKVNYELKTDEIFSLQIAQKSGAYAWAEVTLSINAAKDIYNGKYNTITICATEHDKEECVFIGKVLSNSFKINNGMAIFKVLNKSNNQLQQLKSILENFKKEHLYTEYLNQNGEYAQIIDNQPYDFYYNKSNNSVKLSNIIDKNNIITITDNDHFSDIMKIQNVRKNISKINVSIACNWTQIKAGEQDILPIIASKFPSGIINSYTNIEKYWRYFEKKLNKGIYKIENACLYKLPLKDSVSNFFQAQDGKKIAFKHFWFDGRLNISWEYTQKRLENIEFSIENPNNYKDSIEKDLIININLGTLKVNNDYFSNTYDGNKIITSMASRAFSSIFALNRNTHVTITGEYSKLKNITVDSTIKIISKRFLNNFFIGKVVQTETEIKPEVRLCKIQLLGNEYGFDQFDYQKFMRNFMQKIETIKKIDDKNIIDDIIENIEIRNPPEFQIESLKKNIHKDSKQIIQRLSKIPTFIKVNLRQLKNNSTINYKLNLGNFVL